MKNFLTKSFGVLGLAIYYVLALVIRIPVFIILLIFIVLYLLVLAPITGSDDSPKWINHLYDWYCGK